ncbi:carbohydrate-binding protein [Catelliglobosispora koreensis]|uniref:carbohydrate-binding protein n=1 Tax=Catelliglobosispora koreensis TaxID=129052 RepID=UPI001FDF1A16|nr:carbohydrate-binding protein [Catelliglobosispora koreensis]
MRRRAVLTAGGALVAGALAGNGVASAGSSWANGAAGAGGASAGSEMATGVEGVAEGVGGQAVAAAWQLRWSPVPSVHGLGAFEGVEDDRADSHPAGQPHIFVVGDTYRFNMHMVDRDTMTDRQRQEVRGMSANGGNVIINNGERWLLTHQMYIPASLKATTSFTHIMQTKMPGTGTLPMIVMSLRRHSGVQKIELVAGGVTVGTADLVPLQNKWIDVELDMTVGNTGSVRWVLRDGATTVIDVSRSNVDIWLDDRVRPKWGIYRSLGDTSGSLQDCYMLTRNHHAYEWSDTQPPGKTRYEAESAAISQGVVESNHTGYTGTGFVNLDNIVGSYVQWPVPATAAGTATLTFRYANGTTADRPMDITVNGTVVANDLAFLPTPAWNDWDTRTLSGISLAAGTNLIRATSASSAGGPNLDHLEVQLTPGSNTGYQAESATISQGVVESNHAGFTGTGFVNLDNVVGSYVDFAITGPCSQVTIRYANGTTTNRPMTVNGTTVNFPGTGAWTTWNTVSVPLSLGAGAQSVRLTSTTVNGGPNLDRITITP